MSRFSLSRRTLLRSATATIALPLFDSMLNGNGTALAQGGAIPRRFGIFFWGNGIGWGSGTTTPDNWVPQGTGTGYTPVGQLAGLAPVKDDIAVLTGFKVPGAEQFPHHSGMCSVLSGTRWKSLGPVRDTMIGTFDQPTLDQVVAAKLQGKTPFRSLELGGVPKSYQADEGTTFNGLSHNGPSSVNFPEFSPRAVFDRLFASSLSNEKDRQARLSVLDSVRSDANSLRQRLGAKDKLRLEQHLESIRSIEQRLNTQAPMCNPGTAPTDVDDPVGVQGQKVTQRNQLMAELLATALSCDMTRSFSYLFSYAGTGTVFSECGAVDGHHGKCHFEGTPQPVVMSITAYIMERLRDFTLALKARPEGAGTLLDNCAVICTSELSYGLQHRNDEFPLIVLGRGGGSLNTGFHYRSNTQQSPTQVTLALLKSIDPAMTEFGTGDYYSNQPLPELWRG